MAAATNQNLSASFYSQLALVIVASLTVRFCVSIWKHSGEGIPPMFGDLEAQRHWMEVTSNLPMKDWYVHTEDNDLQYWGLDYPPLTAYHMLFLGKIAQKVNPDMVALKSSRGIETMETKLFMRLSVLLMDLFFFLPIAVAYFVMKRPRDESEDDVLKYILVLTTYPGLVLIDHGHFQYNNVSLGFMVLAVLAVAKKHDLLGSLLFCCALNYKQMELYHALPFFFYLFGACLKMDSYRSIRNLFLLSLTVVISFAVIWLPFLFDQSVAIAVIQRIFPVNRGVYEDKVANFWCSLSVVIKLKQILSHSAMVIICFLFTVFGLLPSSLNLLKNPRTKNFNYALVVSSLIFFLFSFHVHEKSILLAAVPACLLIKTDMFAVIWFLLISVFSMLPLLIKDGLIIPTIVTCSLYWMIVKHLLKPTTGVKKEYRSLFHGSLITATCLSIATLSIEPPKRYPDIFPLLISIFSCVHFMAFAIYFTLRQYDSISALDSKSRNESNQNQPQVRKCLHTSNQSSKKRR